MDSAHNKNIARKYTKIPLNAIQKAYVAGRDVNIDWGGRSCQACIVTDMINVNIKAMRETFKILENNHPMLRAYVYEKRSLKFHQKHFDYPVVTLEDAIILQSRLINEILPLSGPLYAAYIAGNEKRLVLHIDFIIGDGSSLYILKDEIKKTYFRILNHCNENQPEQIAKEVCYFSTKQSTERIEKNPDLSATLLPISIYQKERSPYQLSHREYFIEQEHWQRFKVIAEKYELDPVTALLAIYAIAIGHCGPLNEVTINMTVSTRNLNFPEMNRYIYDFTEVVYVSIPINQMNMLACAQRTKKIKKEALKKQLGYGTEIARRLISMDPINGFSPYVFTCFIGLEKRLGIPSFLNGDSSIRTSTPEVIIDNQLFEKDGGILVCWESLDEAFLNPNMVKTLFANYCNIIKKACLDDYFWETPVSKLVTNDIYSEGRQMAAISHGKKAVMYLSKVGIDIFFEEGKLKYRAPKGKMTENRKLFLKNYKPYMLNYFKDLGG